MPTFKYTILYVDDVAATIEFYQKAFGCEKKFVTPENDYGELVTDGVTLSFASHALASSHFEVPYIKSEKAGQLLGFEIGFTTDNVEETLETALAAGAKLVSPIEQKPWGQKVAYVRDINGFLVEICTPIA